MVTMKFSKNLEYDFASERFESDFPWKDFTYPYTVASTVNIAIFNFISRNYHPFIDTAMQRSFHMQVTLHIKRHG